MDSIAIDHCADSGVIAELHRATITVAYRGYFPHSSPPTLAELQTTWAALLGPSCVSAVSTAGRTSTA